MNNWTSHTAATFLVINHNYSWNPLIPERFNSNSSLKCISFPPSSFLSISIQYGDVFYFFEIKYSWSAGLSLSTLPFKHTNFLPYFHSSIPFWDLWRFFVYSLYKFLLTYYKKACLNVQRKVREISLPSNFSHHLNLIFFFKQHSRFYDKIFNLYFVN